MNRHRRCLIRNARALAFILASTGFFALAAGPYRNIVMILADDLGYGRLNSYRASEQHVRTPGIDRLAEEGRLFTDANTTSSVRPLNNEVRQGGMAGGR